MQKLSRQQALILLAKTTVRPFTKADWMTFAGCETHEPLIGEYHDEYTVVVDGENLNVIHKDDVHGGQLFRLEEV